MDLYPQHGRYEDLFAHDGLYRCYAALSVDAPASVGTADGTAGELLRLAGALEVGPTTERAAVAVTLADAVTRLGRRPPDAKSPRMKPLQEAREKVRAVHAAEADPTAKSALALALATLHRELHALLKPDELARSAAVQAYRSKHPAANAAANAIVIYPTGKR